MENKDKPSKSPTVPHTLYSLDFHSTRKIILTSIYVLVNIPHIHFHDVKLYEVHELRSQLQAQGRDKMNKCFQISSAINTTV